MYPRGRWPVAVDPRHAVGGKRQERGAHFSAVDPRQAFGAKQQERGAHCSAVDARQAFGAVDPCPAEGRLGLEVVEKIAFR